MNENERVNASASGRQTNGIPSIVTGVGDVAMTHVPFEREELIKLRERAEGFVDACHLSQTWHRAYLALADAADHLDAMIARSSGVGGFSPNAPDQPASATEQQAGSYTNWDDASLGKLCKKVALFIDDKKGEHAVQATGAALLLIEAAVHADSRRSSWKIEGATIPEPVGDFEILINRLSKNRENAVDAPLRPMVN